MNKSALQGVALALFLIGIGFAIATWYWKAEINDIQHVNEIYCLKNHCDCKK